MKADPFLHTTHRTVSWFNKVFSSGELELSAPYQRNPVWTLVQKAYLLDTILLGLPIPELYMQDLGDEKGAEKHVVVDGQQRIRAVLEFLNGEFSLEGDDISRQWRGLFFEDLDPDRKKLIFGYKFVVRVLPEMSDEEIRKIFSRLNRNVVALNEQELRNATYWGPFITSIQSMADEQEFWAESGVFTANDHRRMLDHEFISELAVAFLHGPQNKKDKLDQYYQLYEETFEERRRLETIFRKVTDEIAQLMPNLRATRWRKKSDFYTLFLEVAARAAYIPWSKDERATFQRRLESFGERVTRLLKLEEDDWGEQDEDVMIYAKHVARAASDRGARVARAKALSRAVFEPTQLEMGAANSLN